MKNLIFLGVLLIAFNAMSQNTSVAFEKAKINQAKTYGDESVITAAMYNIIALEGPQSTYKDSLAYRYFSKRNYISCYLVTNDLLKTKPEKLDFLEMNAVCLESMGALEKAKEAYQNLLAKTNENYHAYKLAGLEFRMNENEKAYATIKSASNLKDSGDLNITFQVNENYNQNIGLKASIAYLEGVIAESLNKNNEAKASYEKAILLSPDFMLAKNNLEVLNAKMAEGQ